MKITGLPGDFTMRTGILAIILGLIYILLLYAALPLGLIALLYGAIAVGKARRNPAGRVTPEASELDLADGRKPMSPYDEAMGFVWLGVILAVVGASVNAYHYFGA